MKPRHPGATPAQRRALDAIGAGDASPKMADSVRDKLVAAGLIVELPPLQIPFAGRLMMQVRQFEMTPATHMAWCAHCSATAAEGAGTPHAPRQRRADTRQRGLFDGEGA